MKLFMKAKLYQGLNKGKRLRGSLEAFKKVGYSPTMGGRRIKK